MTTRRFFLEGAPSVRARLARADWLATTAWDFDLYWRRQVPSLPFFEQLPPGARINHIPGIAALTSPARRPSFAAQGQNAGVSLDRLVLIASVDPLRLFVDDGAAPELAAPLRDALDALVVDAVAAAYDALVRRVRDHLVDRAAPFELLGFSFRVADEGMLSLASCALSPDIDDEVAAEVLALVGVLPREAGGPSRFRRLVPGSASRAFLDACPWPRWSDVVENGVAEEEIRLTHVAESRITGGAVVLFHPPSARLHVLNDTAGYIWERTREELAPNDVATAIADQFGLDADRARDDVWDALARWANDEWITRGPAREASPPAIDHPGRCLLGASGAIVASACGDAIVLVGRDVSGVAGVAAMLAATHGFRVVCDAPWVDEASGRAVPAVARLAVHEGDDADVAAVSPSFSSASRHLGPNEIVLRWWEPEPWRGEPPVVGPVVVVRRAPRGASTTLRPLSVRELLLELVGHGMRADPPWSTARARDLLAWLEETPAYLLEMRDVASGAETIDSVLSRDQ